MLAEALAKVPGVLTVLVGAFLLNLLVNRALKLLADRTSLEHHHLAPFRRVLRWLIVEPSLALQSFTTREPEPAMIDVAEACFSRQPVFPQPQGFPFG